MFSGRQHITHRQRSSWVRAGIPKSFGLIAVFSAIACSSDNTAAPKAIVLQNVPEIAIAPPSSDSISLESAMRSADRARAARGNRTPAARSLARSVRELVADSISGWRRSLDRIASTSKRGESGVALRRQLLDALAAPTEKAYREKLKRLPVAIRNEPGTHEGKQGYYRTYSLNGVTRMRWFFADRTAPEAPTEESSEPGGPLVNQTDATEGTFANFPLAEQCSYNSPETGYITGECATQEQVDEVGIMTSVMDEEISMYHSDLMNTGGCDLFANGEHCGNWENETEQEEDNEELATGGPCQTESDSGFLSSSGMPRCAGDAFRAGLKVFGWVGSKYGAWRLIMSAGAANPPTAAVVFVTGAVLTTGWGAAEGILTYYNCRNSTR